MITFKELEEQLDEAHKVGDKVLIHKGPADVKGKEGHVSEIRKGLYKGAPKTYTVDYDHHETTGARKSIQLKPTHFKAVKEDLDEARMTAAMKLQKAFQDEQEKRERERKAGQETMKKAKEDSTKVEGYNSYHNNRTGFAKKSREDDEYHTPDPTTRTHKIAHTVSKDGGEKHSRTVTISHSTKTPEQAKATARAHLEKQGYTIHEEVMAESVDHHAEAEEHLSKANDSEAKGDMKSFHAHMANHHEAMSMWHDSKGRSASADKHMDKADYHHEKSFTESVEIDEATGHTIEAHGIKGTKGTPWRKTFKSADHMNAWADKNDSVEVHGTRELEHKANTSNKSVKEDVVTEEAIPVQHVVNGVHKVLGAKSAVRFLTHLKPKSDKHTTWDKTNKALMDQGVKTHHIAKIASHVKPAQFKEDVACNNVGGGAIAGTQGDAGKKSVAIKMMKRKELKNFKEFTE